MGTCLGPRHDKNAIYVELIDQIYRQADDIDAVETTGSDLYEKIKNKLTKKNLFRKLTDHLSSHRNFLNDCMQQNFRVMRVKKTFVSRTTCLIVIDQFLRNLQQFTNLPIRPRLHSSSTPSHKHHHPTPQAMVHRDLDYRFQTIYFQVIEELYVFEPRLREKALQSLCLAAAKRESCFENDELLSEILRKIVEGIADRKDLTQYTRTYAVLLGKSREEVPDQEDSQEALRIFLDLWMGEDGGEEVMANCEQTVKIFISRCLTTRQYLYVFTIIFQIYDRSHFHKPLIGPLQHNLLQILQGQDLRDQFLKGMFKYLITYLCVCQNQQTRSRWQLGIFELPYQTIKRNFPNITLKQTKKHGFETMLRWIELGFINVGDLVAYNRNTFVYSFLFNVGGEGVGDRELVEVVVRTFEEIVRLCDVGCLSLVFEILMEELYKTKDQETGTIIFSMAKKCIQEKDFIDSATTDQYQIYIRPLDKFLPLKTLTQIIDLFSMMIHSCEPTLCQPLFQAICICIQSIPDLLKSPSFNLPQKYILISTITTLMRTLNSKKQQQLLIAFIDQLHLRDHDTSLSDSDRYMFRVLLFEIYSILAGKKEMPGEMQTINHKLREQKVEEEIRQYLAGNPQWPEMRSNGEMEVLRRESNKKRVDLIKKYFDRLQKRKSKDDDQSEIQVRLSLRQQNSIVERPSTRGDESFDEIYAMVKEDSL